MFLIGCQAEFGPWGAGTLLLAKHLKSNIMNADPKEDGRATFGGGVGGGCWRRQGERAGLQEGLSQAR